MSNHPKSRKGKGEKGRDIKREKGGYMKTRKHPKTLRKKTQNLRPHMHC